MAQWLIYFGIRGIFEACRMWRSHCECEGRIRVGDARSRFEKGVSGWYTSQLKDTIVSILTHINAVGALLNLQFVITSVLRRKRKF